MKRVFLIFVLLLLLVIVTIALNRNSGKYIDDMPHQLVAFSSLPTEVQNVYQHSFSKIDTYIVDCFCLDCNYNCEVETFPLEKNMFKLIFNGSIYKIKVGNNLFKMKANTGEPFVFYKTHFFYPAEFNIDEKNYSKINYYQVELSRCSGCVYIP